ncbi:hypothetical protein GCM10010302_07510 [Streptomyces polychromogenes]|uniref:Uncharacterized protein n=1 Tax=Streptomyces polychromogenes TaxID=67342 RepID=A0ABP3EPV2_9ACTN
MRAIGGEYVILDLATTDRLPDQPPARSGIRGQMTRKDKMTQNDLGSAEYQLHLLETMRPLPETLDRVLEVIGCSREQMEQGSERIRSATEMPAGSAGLTREILRDVRTHQEQEGLVERYAFPLWPDYEFEVEYHPAGDFFMRLWFVRAPGSESPTGQPTPWTWLKDEVLAQYEDVKELMLWLPYETYDVLNPQDGKRYFLRFGWHVLQEIDEM